MQNDYCLDAEHKARYEAALKELGSLDSHWKSTFFLLTADPARWVFAEPFVDFKQRLILFDDMKEALSAGPYYRTELCLLELAHYLFNSDGLKDTRTELSMLWEYMSEYEFTQAWRALLVMREAWRGRF